MNLGFKLDEIDNLDIGFAFDLLISKANMTYRSTRALSKKKETPIRMATQEDFDRF